MKIFPTWPSVLLAVVMMKLSLNLLKRFIKRQMRVIMLRPIVFRSVSSPFLKKPWCRRRASRLTTLVNIRVKKRFRLRLLRLFILMIFSVKLLRTSAKLLAQKRRGPLMNLLLFSRFMVQIVRVMKLLRHLIQGAAFLMHLLLKRVTARPKRRLLVVISIQVVMILIRKLQILRWVNLKKRKALIHVRISRSRNVLLRLSKRLRLSRSVPFRLKLIRFLLLSFRTALSIRKRFLFVLSPKNLVLIQLIVVVLLLSKFRRTLSQIRVLLTKRRRRAASFVLLLLKRRRSVFLIKNLMKLQILMKRQSLAWLLKAVHRLAKRRILRLLMRSFLSRAQKFRVVRRLSRPFVILLLLLRSSRRLSSFKMAKLMRRLKLLRVNVKRLSIIRAREFLSLSVPSWSFAVRFKLKRLLILTLMALLMPLLRTRGWVKSKLLLLSGSSFLTITKRTVRRRTLKLMLLLIRSVVNVLIRRIRLIFLFIRLKSSRLIRVIRRSLLIKRKLKGKLRSRRT